MPNVVNGQNIAQLIEIRLKIFGTFLGIVHHVHTHLVAFARQQATHRQAIAAIISLTTENYNFLTVVVTGAEPAYERPRRSLHQIEGRNGFILNRIGVEFADLGCG